MFQNQRKNSIMSQNSHTPVKVSVADFILKIYEILVYFNRDRYYDLRANSHAARPQSAPLVPRLVRALARWGLKMARS